MAQSDANSPKFTFEAELKAERARVLDLEAKLEDAERRNKSKDTQLSKLRKETGAQSEPKPEVKVEPTPVEPKPEPQKEPEPPHSKSSTDRYCPTCGDEDATFKSEAWCKDCARPLGSIEGLQKVKRCGTCGAEGQIAKTTAPPKVRWDDTFKEWKIERAVAEGVKNGR